MKQPGRKTSAEWVVAPPPLAHQITGLQVSDDGQSAAVAIDLVLPDGSREPRNGWISAGELYAMVHTQPARFNGKEEAP